MKNAMRVMKKWTCLLIILALLLTTVPLMGLVEAADSPIVISNPMGTASLPTPVTTSRIDVTGSFYGVTDMKYTVTQMRRIGTDLVPIQTREGVDVPYIVGSTFTFTNVELFQGINEIMVTGRDSSGTSTPSERVYVEYYNLPIILTVMYGEQDLKVNKTITEKLYNDELLIKGQVMNAETIIAKINGDSTEYQGTVLTTGQYIIAKIPLQRGKNNLEIIARNNTKEYPVNLEITYNDGYPYVANIKADVDGLGTFVNMEKQMNFTANDMEITGEFSNFEVGDTVNFLFNTTNFSVTYEKFDTEPVDIVIPFLSSVAEDYNYQLYKTGPGTFRLHYNTVKQNETNILQFSFSRNMRNYIQTFYLEHFNDTLNYVTRTAGLPSTTTTKSLTFYIFTKDIALDDPLDVEIIHQDGSGTNIPLVSRVNSLNPTDNPIEVMHKVSVDLVPGKNVITVRPNKGADADVNKKVYNILYINSPDIKILNLVNGDRIGDGVLQPEIIGELINVGLGDRDKTTIKIENRLGSATYKLELAAFTGFQFTFDLTNKLQTGANDIVFTVTDGTTTTTTRMTIFYFSSDGPSAYIGVDEAETLTINPDATFRDAGLGVIETEARYVELKGGFNNANDIIFYLNGVRVIQEEVQATGKKTCVGYNPVTKEAFRITIDWDTKTFSTDYPIYLTEGSNVVEVEVVSSTGTSRSEKLYLRRVLPPVKLVSPNLDRESVVNSNYVEVIIEASGADSVTIDKKEAQYITLTNDELRDLIEVLGNFSLSKYDLDGNNYLDDSELALVDQSEIIGKRYKADVFLKVGKNTIKYEVTTNGKKNSYQFEIYYAASPEEGAKYKESFAKNKISVFNKELTLEFPKNTWLIEPDDLTPSMNEYISDAYLEFGIVDKQTGKLNKVWNSSFQEYVFEEFNEPYKTLMPVRIIPPDRTGYAGDIYWIESQGNVLDVDSGLIPTNRGKITIKYDPRIVSDAQNQLAVYHFDRTKYEWVNLGGTVDTKGKTVTANITEFGYYTVMAKRGTYNDIIKHSWAANFLHALYSKGIMMPESYSRFGSDLLTTRGEFATILIKALNIQIDAGPYVNGNKLYPVNPTFVDVNPLLDPENGFYSYEYIETAARAGIIRGMGQGEFNAEGLLTRQDAAAMIARAANYKLETDLDKAKAGLQKMYTDTNKINNYSMPYVLAVSKANIMGGSELGGSIVFNPSSYLSRAEASAIAYRLMVQMKVLPK